MQIEKAIELNKESEKSLRNHKFQDHADAIRLGNEALKEVQNIRAIFSAWQMEPLPGED